MATKLLDVLVVQYPVLREAVRSVAGIVMEQAYEAALEEVDDLLAKEKDPFTVRKKEEYSPEKGKCVTIVYNGDCCSCSLAFFLHSFPAPCPPPSYFRIAKVNNRVVLVLWSGRDGRAMGTNKHGDGVTYIYVV